MTLDARTGEGIVSRRDQVNVSSMLLWMPECYEYSISRLKLIFTGGCGCACMSPSPSEEVKK